MKYYSTRNKSLRVSLKEAVVGGIASDGGLFMPESINPLHASWFSNPPDNLKEIAFDVSRQLVGDDIPFDDLKSIVDKAMNFKVKLVQVEENVWSLELFHGPTLAFKDFGARFLAGLMEYYARDLSKEIIVLAATSGDTGSAVANGFFNKKGIRVIILYPSGRVSPLQEKQLTTLGGNISAWEVNGNFDDCQRLVKEMFLDEELKRKFMLTSANSINIGRLLPQTFYYFYAWSKTGGNAEIVFSVPSGNFGNLTAGVIAMRLGLPVQRFIASTNINDVVPSYLSGATYTPRPSASTISNAMDVGDPSNFSRLLDLYDGSREGMAHDIYGCSFSDAETNDAIRSVLKGNSYLMDPHGAVAYLGLRKYQRMLSNGVPGVFLETAHPGKFHEVVEKSTGQKIDLPIELSSLNKKEKRSTLVSSDFQEAKQLLLKSAN